MRRWVAIVGIVLAVVEIALFVFLYWQKHPTAPSAPSTFTKTFDAITNASKLPSQTLRELVFGTRSIALTGGTRTVRGTPNMWFTYATTTPVGELYADYTASLPHMGWQIITSTQTVDTASLTITHTGWPDPKPFAAITITSTAVGSQVSISVDNLVTK